MIVVIPDSHISGSSSVEVNPTVGSMMVSGMVNSGTTIRVVAVSPTRPNNSV